MNIHDLSLTELRRLLDRRELSSEEITRTFLDRIEATDETINAFITVCEDEALAAARLADQRMASGEAAKLTGIPVAVKDIFNTQGIRTTCGSKILANYIAPYDATVISRLKQQGAVILGKLNMDEFAMGSSNESTAFGPVRNPWNLSLIHI